jgi:hypothetical protein
MFQNALLGRGPCALKQPVFAAQASLTIAEHAFIMADKSPGCYLGSLGSSPTSFHCSANYRQAWKPAVAWIRLERGTVCCENKSAQGHHQRTISAASSWYVYNWGVQLAVITYWTQSQTWRNILNMDMKTSKSNLYMNLNMHRGL